jgi:murein DD-endopeptidase MepM/ murein hydrolase activator NlpD
MVKRILPVCVVILGFALSACGSTSAAPSTTTHSGSASSTSQTSNSSGAASATISDPCTLLSASDITALLGVSVPATPGINQGAGSGLPARSCTWGSPINATGVVSVLVASTDPGTGANYADTLVDSSGPAGTSVAVAGDGKIVDRAVVAGGGGIGRSIIFHKNGLTVVIAVVKGAVDQNTLVAASQNAAAKV